MHQVQASYGAQQSGLRGRSAKSGLVFVGEGPGFDEDRQGRPFVGRAGKLLDKMIFAIGFERQEVYICNVVKCRPPENRAPQPDETAACSPFLFRQIEALSPKVICAWLERGPGPSGEHPPDFPASRQGPALAGDTTDMHIPSGLSIEKPFPKSGGMAGPQGSDQAPPGVSLGPAPHG